MSKSSVVCEACGKNNVPNSEFCIGCGSKLPMSSVVSKVDTMDEKEKKYLLEREKYFKSVPVLFAVIIFLVFIDWVDNRSIDWAFYPAVPIFLFAIAAPYFNFRKAPSNTN